MSHRDRLVECVYTSPSGKAYTLLVDEVERNVSKKSAIHELAGRDGSVVQDNGKSTRKYPIVGLIDGSDYDLTADALAAALEETGSGKLQHPRWGSLPVLPLSYAQSESFVDGSRVAKFSIDFVHTPPAVVSSTATTAAALQSAADTTAALVDVKLPSSSAFDLAAMRKALLSTAKSWASRLQGITGATEEMRSEINATGLAIQRSADILISAPLDLCESLTSLARIPAKAEGAIASKAKAYASLITDTLLSLGASTVGQAALAVATLSALDIAVHECITSGTLASRDDATLAAESLSGSHASILAAIETLEATGFVTPPDLLEALVANAANAQTYLLDKSYSLAVERRVILTADRSPLELIRELKGEVDDWDAALDEFCAENHLGRDAFLVLPRGMEIRYYAR